ncbi:predicted protein [Thalassiosira pseudonana CCMP1335]|uniref:Symplekin C-terminal domain-containing protein n=1 Tax=Thalassiosira pseudonana TaxID=35128 RepID=B8BYA6_THAPS|nr:predicted protein [Thalassiosira pseudonana CCMP1335]EED93855.1 predicted protein [Thalassiosira pseudonana CCMP1335]
MMQLDDPHTDNDKNINPDLITDDDDNAATDDISEDENESPLVLALDDLESRIVASLNEFKSHPGRASNPRERNIHQELADILRPVVEASSHAGPSTARALAQTYPRVLGLEMCVDEIYTRVNSELVLPVVLESAQSDVVPAKRAASLAMFHTLYGEWQKGGSYLDGTTNNVSLSGPYGVGGASSSSSSAAAGGPQLLSSMETSRRSNLRSARKAELLRRWVQSAIPNLAPGTFTSSTLDAAAAGRGVLSASAALKPCLRYMAQRIGSADDAVMRMIEGVLGRLFLERARNNSGMEVDGGEKEGDALRSSCIKFLEIVVLCFSNKALPGAGAGQTIGRAKKDASHVNDFSLEDLPPGHPIITRESLEEIGEYAYSTLRGLVVLGGQAKIDPNLLLAAAASSSGGTDFMGGGSSPMSQIVAIIKPAALAFQTIESEAEKTGGGEPNTKNGFVLDRSSIELDFCLSQKSYSISINAIQMLGTKRPIFFKESSTCLARRTMDPPGESSGEAEGLLPKAAITAIRTHLRSSCLTMLRHFISVTSGSHEILVNALTEVGMGSQAERALQASKNQLNLMKGGRAARNRAAVFYEWDQSADASRAEKRQRDTDDAEARVRSAKIARGLGSGVQLPTSMADACELVLLNLKNLPPKRPPVASTTHRKHPVDLDFVVDAVLSNGASLSIDENHWYDRDGGDAWEMEEGEVANGGRKELSFHLNEKILETATNAAQKEELGDAEKVFAEQTRAAASKAFSRVLLSASSARSGAVANYGKQLAARLAWTLQGVQPSADIESAHLMAVETTEKGAEKTGSSGSLRFAKEYPLVSTCLAFDLVPKLQTSLPSDDNGSSSTALAASALSTRVLNEAYVCSVVDDGGDTEQKKRYGECLDVYVSSVVSACDSANKKHNDNEKKRIATNAASLLPHQLGAAPSITPSALNLVGSLCDIDEVSKKAVKTSRQSIAESAAAHAAKAAAEKRATAALLILRDVAFQRDAVRGSAIDCAVSIASGRLPASAPIEDKALKLVMNVIFPKNSDCASKVMESATKELEFATQYAIDNHDEIEKANKVNARKKEKLGHVSKSLLQPQSEEEKIALDRVRKPVVLIMALCVRRPEKIKDIMEMSCRDGADVLAKAVKTNMPKLAKAAAAKHGAATIALKVADMASEKETPLLLCFLDNLAPASDKTMPSQELIDACYEIQKNRPGDDGILDTRYIIPVLSGMKRHDLVHKLPDFVREGDETFKTCLRRMSERLSRYALIFRDEPDPAEKNLRGMSSCEQMVYLHHLDFNAVGLPQKRYLDAIRLCLEDDGVFNDRIIQAALDYMSGKFLEGEALPLAYMRTIILTCSKHESLHSWICHVLLPRLVEGKVYSDKRQWEGWMRCAKMLENGDHGVSSLEAVQKLPEEQLKTYRAKYPKA